MFVSISVKIFNPPIDGVENFITEIEPLTYFAIELVIIIVRAASVVAVLFIF